MEDVIIIGGGPCGLSAAIECERVGLSAVIIEKHNIVQSIYLYPTHMQFFSTAELLEIGNVPFSSANDKPFRYEALAYYRKVAEHFGLRIHNYEEAREIQRKEDGTFEVHTVNRRGETIVHQGRHVVVATGYFDHPNYLGIPGEDKDKVTHYFREAHPYTNTRVAIIGGSNSAVDAAMELVRVGAHIDMVYRGTGLSEHIKPWVRPLFESMVQKNRITLHLGSRVNEILDDSIRIVHTDGSESELENDFVLAMTGFRPDRQLLASIGAEMSEDMDKPLYDPQTMESSVPGVYVGGVIASGRNANEVFIESGRWHGRYIAEHIISKTEHTIDNSEHRGSKNHAQSEEQ
ncbi:YpdA family putative bacillithiol disulfide reductase [Paenibacillus polysaccharolyticus]|uniref:YpdA family putative bacillithiol disulfide reductase n=1 Tax=Paenibacillus TaxID=44249 RepID=UPI0020A012A5|nr:MULTISPECIES: YpdA family putative bacillithiol disulfide reductase [Paenibacillus]MCP1134513.1 YpdA family putative bacillithiol disulfide reductase [Paenibacillus polysaccharolyticus]